MIATEKVTRHKLMEFAPMTDVKIRTCTDLNRKTGGTIERVADGSVIVRFNKTPRPEGPTDVVCPHFLELKWAYGCPYSCSWCYLQGTFRWPQFKKHGSNIDPVVKDEKKIAKHLSVISQDGFSEILNAGELADSLMSNWLPKFLLDINLGKNRVLLLTKSDRVDFLLDHQDELRGKVIMSFTLNAPTVADRWEKGAPPVEKRLEAARKVSEARYETRVRIDPLVPVDGWKRHYLDLIDMIFDAFIPERITLGSLRGLQSTINAAKDKSWVPYMTEKSNWGKKVPFKTRYEMYSTVMTYLEEKHGYTKVALCKETVEVWEKLGMDHSAITCNCI